MKVVGRFIMVFGVLILVGSIFLYASEISQNARVFLEESADILDRHDDALRSTGHELQGVEEPLGKIGGFLRRAGENIEWISSGAGASLKHAGDKVYSVGRFLGDAGSDLVETGNDMSRMAGQLKTLSNGLIVAQSVVAAGIGVVALVFILIGAMFWKSGRQMDVLKKRIQSLEKKMDTESAP